MILDDAVPVWWCPTCGTRLDAAMNLTGARAVRPGDLTVCGYCAAVLIFNDQRRLSRPAPGQLAAYQADEERWAVVARAVAAGRRQRRS
jgi:hypothetical protein